MSSNIRNCRICLDVKTKSRISFDIDSEWSRLLEYCMGLHVTDNKAPRVLCLDCADKLSEYGKFKKRCLKSDSLWKSITPNKLVCSENKPPIEIMKVKIAEIKKEPTNEEQTIDVEDFDTYEDNGFIENDELEGATYVKVETIEAEPTSYRRNKNTDYDYLNPVHLHRRKRPRTEVNVTHIVNEDSYNFSDRKNFIYKYFEECPLEKIESDKPKKTLQCFKCGIQYRRCVVFKNCKVLLRHIKKCYGLTDLDYEKEDKPKLPPSPLYYCGLCELKSPDNDLIKQHVKEHYSNNEFNCKLCDYEGRDIADVIAHRYKHHPPEYSHKFMCTECTKTIGTVLKLEYHCRSEHLKKPGGWCSLCDFTCTSYKSYRNHVRWHKVTKFICDHCGKNFLNRWSIKCHLVDHSDVRNHICHTCGKAFKRRTALEAHIKRMHVMTTPVVCTHCNKTFKSEVTLKEHMKDVNREKKFVCDVCSKAFGLLCDLKSHRFFHTGEKPHECKTCGNKYKVKAQLKIHMRLHTGYKPFQCSHCDKAFISSQQYKVHQAVHTGIRRHKCQYCERSFNDKKLLFSHCKSKHKIEDILSFK